MALSDPWDRGHNETWSAVDSYGEDQLMNNDSKHINALNHALGLAKANELPEIQVSALQGKFLALQCRVTKAKHALEVGTLGGYSSIWLAWASPDIKITTIEISSKNKEVAEKAIAHAGLADRIEVILGAGIDVLRGLQQEVTQGARPKYDFVFIDADKPNNRNYLELSIPICDPGSLIFVDNVVRRGYVADAEAAKQDAKVKGSREVVEAAGKDLKLDCTLLQTVGDKGYDGFLMCVVK